MQRYEELIARLHHSAHLSVTRKKSAGWGTDILLEDQPEFKAAEAITALCGELEEALEALETAQRSLSMMVEPTTIQRTNLLHAWAQAVEAEKRTRAILAKHKEKKDG